MGTNAITGRKRVTCFRRSKLMACQRTVTRWPPCGMNTSGREPRHERWCRRQRNSANPHSGRSGLTEVLSDLAQFYPDHIWKEEYLLLPLATKVLSAQDDEGLIKEFASVESDIFSYVRETMSN